MPKRKPLVIQYNGQKRGSRILHPVDTKREKQRRTIGILPVNRVKLEEEYGT